MKPPIEYRPKPFKFKRERVAVTAKAGEESFIAISEVGDFIVIRRDRAKYNAYMRAYRLKVKAKKKAAK